MFFKDYPRISAVGGTLGTLGVLALSTWEGVPPLALIAMPVLTTLLGGVAVLGYLSWSDDCCRAGHPGDGRVTGRSKSPTARQRTVPDEMLMGSGNAMQWEGVVATSFCTRLDDERGRPTEEMGWGR